MRDDQRLLQRVLQAKDAPFDQPVVPGEASSLLCRGPIAVTRGGEAGGPCGRIREGRRTVTFVVTRVNTYRAYYVPSSSRHFASTNSTFTTIYQVGTTMMPALQTRKTRHREVKQLAQRHAAIKLVFEPRQLVATSGLRGH